MAATMKRAKSTDFMEEGTVDDMILAGTLILSYVSKIHKAVKNNANVVSVDGSYLYPKHKQLQLILA